MFRPFVIWIHICHSQHNHRHLHITNHGLNHDTQQNRNRVIGRRTRLVEETLKMTIGSDSFQKESLLSKEQDNTVIQYSFQYPALRPIQPHLRPPPQITLIIYYCYATSNRLQLPCVFLLFLLYPTIRLLSLWAVVLMIHAQRGYPEPEFSDYATALLLWNATLSLVRPLNYLVCRIDGWFYPEIISSDTIPCYSNYSYTLLSGHGSRRNLFPSFVTVRGAKQ